MFDTRLLGVAPALCLLFTASSPTAAHATLSAPLFQSVDSHQATALRVARDGDERQLALPGGPVFHRTSNEVLDARCVTTPGAGRVALWQERSGGTTRSHYAIDPDGGGFRRARTTSYELALRRGRFTPAETSGAPAGPTLGRASELHLVQFVCPPTAAMRAALVELGAEVHQFIPNHARVVRMSSATRAAVEALAFVRWVGPYSADLRVEPELQAELEAGRGLPTQRYNVQVLERGPAMKQRVAARIAGLGGRVDLMIPDGFLLEATLTADQLLAIAGDDEVLWIDRASDPEADMGLVRQAGGATYLELVEGYTGAGVRGEVMDDNLRVSHQDFQSAPFLFHGPRSGDTDHGTKAAGCLFGDGTGLASARGVLPEAQPIFADYGYLTNRYTHTAALLQAPYEAVLQSNSWGHAVTTQYNTKSMELDDVLFRNDLTIVQSQSNTGDQQSRPQAWAKNVLSVGGVRHQNTASYGDDSWSHTASIGPAADGRVKPDLVFFYDSVQTTDDQHDSSYTNSFSGTSAATPCVAGFVGLVQEMWADGLFGNTPEGSSVFERRAKATTVRALMVNSARQYFFSGTNADLTRTHQGWGLPDVKHLHMERERTFVVNEEVVLGELESASYALTVLPGEPELRVTMTYLDLPGTTSASLHRVNDLTLRVTAPDGKIYWGNHGLLTGNWSQPGGGPNTVDVIENVFLQNPLAGTWTVEVFADELNGDSHLETPALDCDFALVVSGVQRPGDCPTPTGYCDAKPTSLGTLPAISSTGSASVAANDLALTLTGGVPGQHALAFSGSGANSAPFLGGTLCIQGPLQRLGSAQLDGQGAASFPLDIAGETPGESGWFQVWFRDPLDPTGFGVGLSDGLEVSYCD